MARKSLPGPRVRPSGTGWLDASYVLSQQPQDTGHVLDILGVEGRVSGSELSGRCPMHEDRRASFSVSLETGLWTCHAGCGGGSLAWLVAQAAGIRAAKAERWLEGAVLAVPADDDADTIYPEIDEERWLQRFISPPGSELASREISAQAAADLSIRWNARARGTVGAWILPVRHPDTCALIGWEKKISGSLEDDGVWTEPGTRKSHTLFGIDQFEPGDPVILVESPLDVAVLRTAGLPGLASFGANVSRRQRKLLADRASRIVLALDNDRAGRQAHTKLVQSPEFAGKELYRFNYEHTPGAKDPGEMKDDEIREALRTAKRIRR
jgi:hypothetical protein